MAVRPDDPGKIRGQIAFPTCIQPVPARYAAALAVDMPRVFPVSFIEFDPSFRENS